MHYVVTALAQMSGKAQNKTWESHPNELAMADATAHFLQPALVIPARTEKR
jgi:hypothetical protein